LPGIEESEPAPSETVATEPSSLSAFSLMSNYRNFRSSQAPSSASSNPVSGGSRISQMVDRLLNHYRTTRFSNGSAHRSSPCKFFKVLKLEAKSFILRTFLRRVKT
jgi:hypothetical protein